MLVVATGSPVVWRRCARAWQTSASLVGEVLRVPCLVCGLVVSACGLVVYRIRRISVIFCALVWCVPCLFRGFVSTRLRCMRHIEPYTAACIAASRRGECEQLLDAVIVQLGLVDAALRSAARHAGKSYSSRM